MAFTPAQANTLFDILLEKGNHPARYSEYRRHDFVQNHTDDGVWEFWYSTNSGSSMKLYYTIGLHGKTEIAVRPQTYNPIHEKTLKADLQVAVDEFVKVESEKRALRYSQYSTSS